MIGTTIERSEEVSAFEDSVVHDEVVGKSELSAAKEDEVVEKMAKEDEVVGKSDEVVGKSEESEFLKRWSQRIEKKD